MRKNVYKKCFFKNPFQRSSSAPWLKFRSLNMNFKCPSSKRENKSEVFFSPHQKSHYILNNINYSFTKTTFTFENTRQIFFPRVCGSGKDFLFSPGPCFFIACKYKSRIVRLVFDTNLWRIICRWFSGFRIRRQLHIAWYIFPKKI